MALQPSVWGPPADWSDFPLPEPAAEPAADPRPAPSRRRLVAVLTAAAVVIAAIGFAATRPGRPSPTAQLKAAAARTQAGRTLAFTATTTVLTGGQSLTVARLTGQTDFQAHNGQFTLVSPSNPGVHGTVRYLGDLAFFQYDGLPLPNGAQWTEVNPIDLAASPSAAAALGGGDPTRSLQVLGALVGQPVFVGHETMDGAATTHYRVDLDLANLLARIGEAATQLSATLGNVLSAAASTADLHRVTGEVWLDSAGRVRRLDYRINITANGVATVEMASLQLSQFGSPVHVSPPPDDQVVPFSLVRDRLPA